MRSRSIILMTFLLLALSFIVSACGSSTGRKSNIQNPKSKIELAPESALPDFARDTPPQIQEAYRFAIANPDILEQIPCYCGCGGMGHGSNLNCYVAAFEADGTVAEFDNHAAYWTICADITRDVMKMLQEGREMAEIRAYIDAEYSQYGPPTDTEPVQGESQSSCSEQITEACGEELGGQTGPVETTPFSQMTVPETAGD